VNHLRVVGLGLGQAVRAGVGQVEHRGGAQATVEVVVQEHLGAPHGVERDGEGTKRAVPVLPAPWPGCPTGPRWCRRWQHACAGEPLPHGGDCEGAEDRADDADGADVQAVARDEAEDQATEERSGQAGNERERPVDLAAAPSEDELGHPAAGHAEHDDEEDEHAPNLVGGRDRCWRSVRSAP
jgi:hypothetical protein